MNPEARRRLEELLDREIELARSLAATLAAEKSALTGNSPAAVELNAADKIRLFDALEKLEAERNALWHGPEGAGLAATIAERWRALLQLMASCRIANEVNGHIIHIRQNQVRQLIDIVRGGPAITYDNHGKTMAKALRALARA
jgi:flagellar biosynthesis/type III secretory pathway chaperone